MDEIGGWVTGVCGLGGGGGWLRTENALLHAPTNAHGVRVPAQPARSRPPSPHTAWQRPTATTPPSPASSGRQGRAALHGLVRHTAAPRPPASRGRQGIVVPRIIFLQQAVDVGRRVAA